jgi:hypothetical protein
MEPSPFEAKTSREGVQLLGGVPDQVGPLAAPPTDAAVVYVHSHPILSTQRPRLRDSSYVAASSER